MTVNRTVDRDSVESCHARHTHPPGAGRPARAAARPRSGDGGPGTPRGPVDRRHRRAGRHLPWLALPLLPEQAGVPPGRAAADGGGDARGHRTAARRRAGGAARPRPGGVRRLRHRPPRGLPSFVRGAAGGDAGLPGDPRAGAQRADRPHLHHRGPGRPGRARAGRHPGHAAGGAWLERPGRGDAPELARASPRTSRGRPFSTSWPPLSPVSVRLSVRQDSVTLWPTPPSSPSSTSARTSPPSASARTPVCRSC